MGPEPLIWADIAAFCSLSGLRLRPWEIEIIERLDDVWLSAAFKDGAGGEGGPNARPMSPQLFDAVFG